MNLDFSFLSWGIVQSFVLKGLWFSIQLTLIAMVGGILWMNRPRKPVIASAPVPAAVSPAAA